MVTAPGIAVGYQVSATHDIKPSNHFVDTHATCPHVFPSYLQKNIQYPSASFSPGILYSFRCVATNKGGDSLPSNTKSLVVIPNPPSLGQMTASGPGSGISAFVVPPIGVASLGERRACCAVAA